VIVQPLAGIRGSVQALKKLPVTKIPQLFEEEAVDDRGSFQASQPPPPQSIVSFRIAIQHRPGREMAREHRIPQAESPECVLESRCFAGE